MAVLTLKFTTPPPPPPPPIIPNSTYVMSLYDKADVNSPSNPSSIPTSRFFEYNFISNGQPITFPSRVGTTILPLDTNCADLGQASWGMNEVILNHKTSLNKDWWQIKQIKIVKRRAKFLSGAGTWTMGDPIPPNTPKAYITDWIDLPHTLAQIPYIGYDNTIIKNATQAINGLDFNMLTNGRTINDYIDDKHFVEPEQSFDRAYFPKITKTWYINTRLFASVATSAFVNGLGGHAGGISGFSPFKPSFKRTQYAEELIYEVIYNVGYTHLNHYRSIVLMIPYQAMVMEYRTNNFNKRNDSIATLNKLDYGTMIHNVGSLHNSYIEGNKVVDFLKEALSHISSTRVEDINTGIHLSNLTPNPTLDNFLEPSARSVFFSNNFKSHYWFFESILAEFGLNKMNPHLVELNSNNNYSPPDIHTSRVVNAETRFSIPLPANASAFNAMVSEWSKVKRVTTRLTYESTMALLNGFYLNGVRLRAGTVFTLSDLREGRLIFSPTKYNETAPTKLKLRDGLELLFFIAQEDIFTGRRWIVANSHNPKQTYFVDKRE